MNSAYLGKIAGVFILFFSPVSGAVQPPTTPDLSSRQCWSKEINPETRRLYRDSQEWEADLRRVTALRPPQPNLFSLVSALHVANEAVSYVNKHFRSDKTKHCYVGCQIAYRVNSEAAVFAGWQKELSDLTDCETASHYEIGDYEATADGIDFAEMNPGGYKDRALAKATCHKLCLKHFGR